MTSQQMQEECRIYADKVDSATLPEFFNREWDYFLNEAQARFVKTRYGLTNIYQQGFESIQKRTDDLDNIVYTEDSVLVNSNTYPQFGEVNIDLRTTEQPYMFFIKALCKTEYKECPRWDDLKIIPHDKFGRIINDPYNRPEKWDTVGLFEGGKLLILYDLNSSLEEVKLTYIRKPQDIIYDPANGIFQDCELAEHTHKEIVQMAVSLAIESVMSPRTQTTIQNLPNIE